MSTDEKTKRARYLKVRLRKTRGILFDLDNTLYPREMGVFDLIRERISQYVARLTGLGGEEVMALRREYISRYGTTLGGLMNRHKVDPEGFLEFVHDFPVEEMLRPDPELSAFLQSIDLPMVIFTNASRKHAERVLKTIGIEGFFRGICDLEDTGYLGKPHREAYEKAAGFLSLPLDRTLFFDDVPLNIEAGRRFGALTVFVGPSQNGLGDLHAGRVTDLQGPFRAMPWYRAIKDNGEF